MVNKIKRPNYFRSQFLVENDFLDEQNYHRNMRQRHLLALHAWGVVGTGLQAQKTANSREITISPGVAVDKTGQEIVLTEPRTETVSSATNTEIYLTVRYQDERLDADLYSGPGAGAINDYIRITESPQFEFSDSKPDESSDRILLAQIRLDENGNIANINNSVRKHASSWIAPNATLPGPINIGSEVDAANVSIPGGTLNTRTINTEQVTLSNLTANGNIGIGTTNPAGSLDVQGNVYIGTGRNGENFKLAIRGPNQPLNADSFQDIAYEFTSAGSARIRAYRGSSWDTYLQFLTNRFDSTTNNPQVRLHIHHDGNIGIGTINPTQRLTIQADYAATNDAKQLLIQGNTNPRNQLELGYHTANDYGSIQAVTQGGPVSIGGGIAQPVQPQVPKNLILNPLGGNVGIGTTTTNAKLEVKLAAATIDASLKLEHNGSNFIVRPFSAGGTSSVIENTGGGSLLINPTAGRVGINTSNPAGALDVFGDVYIGTGRSATNHRLVIRGPNQPGGFASYQELSYEFAVAGSARIRAYRGTSWDTYLQFLTNRFSKESDSPEVAIHIHHNGKVGIGTSMPDQNHTLDVLGSIIHNGLAGRSDIRWKKNIETIANALDQVTQLRGVTFEWRKEEYHEMNFNPGRHLGLIAQEVEQVIPEVVHQNEDGYKSLAYSNLVALLIEAIKELHNKHENLLPTIKSQQTEIDALKAEINSLKALLIAQPV